MVRKYTDEQLLKRVQEISTFKSIPKGYWVLGVRSNEDTPNRFDDKFYIWEGTRFVMVMTGTTNPGVSILKNHYKFNSLGAAIVKADMWYYDLWVFGKHRGKIDALLQLGNKILVHRDGDKDDKSEELGQARWGFYGINFHLNSHDINSTKIKGDINGWSAGCQVPNEPSKYKEFMAICRNLKSKISYCLINEFEP